MVDIKFFITCHIVWISLYRSYQSQTYPCISWFHDSVDPIVSLEQNCPSFAIENALAFITRAIYKYTCKSFYWCTLGSKLISQEGHNLKSWNGKSFIFILLRLLEMFFDLEIKYAWIILSAPYRIDIYKIIPSKICCIDPFS